ncbi:MAG TPA: antibiotic biosynthesis monooxygenase [Alphaproteobacteria bacterium]|nr:antibiotic biosynthesis monooxygenase [Alphaproteobacteria bacterium]
MFVLLYEWRVKPGRESEFVEAWSNLTRLIYKRRGSLGSRLHRTEDGRFIAYAQWPGRDAWNISLNEPTTPEEENYRRVMQESAVRKKPDILMTLVEDELVTEPYHPSAPAR